MPVPWDFENEAWLREYPTLLNRIYPVGYSDIFFHICGF